MVSGLPDIHRSIQQCAQHELPEVPVRVVRVCGQAQRHNAATLRVVKPDPRHDERPRAPADACLGDCLEVEFQFGHAATQAQQRRPLVQFEVRDPVLLDQAAVADDHAEWTGLVAQCLEQWGQQRGIDRVAAAVVERRVIPALVPRQVQISCVAAAGPGRAAACPGLASPGPRDAPPNVGSGPH